MVEKFSGTNEHDVLNTFFDAVAHHPIGSEDRSGSGKVLSCMTSTISIGHHHRANLKEAQPKCAVDRGLLDGDGEFDFDLGVEVFSAA